MEKGLGLWLRVLIEVLELSFVGSYHMSMGSILYLLEGKKRGFRR